MTFATKPEVYNAEQVAIVRKQAAFDMSCPEDKLQILEITKQDSGKVDRLGAVGCDKKGAYVRLIDYNGTHWVLDSAESKK